MDRYGPTVFLDACVLYSIVLCDALLTAAKAGLFRPTWSRRVENEWLEAATRHRPEMLEGLERRRDAMRRARPDWEAAGLGQVNVIRLELPDAGDEHVVEAAASVGAAIILTLNLRDFPDKVLAKVGLRALHPDTFLVERFGLNPTAMVEAFEGLRQRLRHPPLGFEAFLDNWVHHGLCLLAARLKLEVAGLEDQQEVAGAAA